MNCFSGNILVAQKGEILFEKSISSDNSINQKTVFPISSITKTITACAIIDLQSKGKINLTDHVSKYIDIPKDLP